LERLTTLLFRLEAGFEYCPSLDSENLSLFDFPDFSDADLFDFDREILNVFLTPFISWLMPPLVEFSSSSSKKSEESLALDESKCGSDDLLFVFYM
jgi:hypothetical protein